MTAAGDSAPILVEVNSGVCVITLNRPQARNAMTAEMAAQYAAALRSADANPDVRAIVVTGAGAGFCAGADLSILREGAEALRKFLPPREDYPDLALRLRKPVIAAVNGAAVGIGFAYMMYSDVRFVAESAKLATMFSQLGLVAEYGLSWLLPRVIGLQPAMELLLSGRTIDGREAERIGLVHRAVPDDQVLPTAIEYASALAKNCSPASLQAIKEQVYADLERPREEAFLDTIARMDVSFGGPDLAEAMQARQEKRPPVFNPLPPSPAAADQA